MVGFAIRVAICTGLPIGILGACTWLTEGATSRRTAAGIVPDDEEEADAEGAVEQEAAGV